MNEFPKSQKPDNTGAPMTQMALDLPVNRSFAIEDLAISPSNRVAVDLICAWPDWPGYLVILAGPIGSGKSHLANIWANQADAKIMTLDDFDQSGTNNSVLQTGVGRAVVIENAGQGAFDEVSLFHFLNTKKSENASVLITSRLWPTQWQVNLPDLASRLRAAQLVELGEPDDQLLEQVLVKHFSDYQLPIESGVIDFLVQRMERSLEISSIVVDKINTLSLQHKTKVTRKLASRALLSLEDLK